MKKFIIIEEVTLTEYNGVKRHLNLCDQNLILEYVSRAKTIDYLCKLFSNKDKTYINASYKSRFADDNENFAININLVQSTSVSGGKRAVKA